MQVLRAIIGALSQVIMTQMQKNGDEQI